MVGKKLKMKEFFHGIIVVIWVISSVIIYGTVCIAVWLFNAKLSRLIGLWWIRHFLKVAGINVKVSGLEKLDLKKQYIFISNHQSHLDIPVLIGSMKHQLSFIAKKELFAIPFFGWGLYALGHIWIDRGNARKAYVSINRALKRLQKDNISLVLFPEGTRSADGTLGRFKQGSFYLAQQAEVELVPIVIRGTHNLLPKHAKLIRKGTVSLKICDPVEVNKSMTKADLSEKLWEIIRNELTSSNN